jgi:hypothetical protein
LFLCKFFYRFLSVERFGGPIPLFAGGGGQRTYHGHHL